MDKIFKKVKFKDLEGEIEIQGEELVEEIMMKINAKFNLDSDLFEIFYENKKLIYYRDLVFFDIFNFQSEEKIEIFEKNKKLNKIIEQKQNVNSNNNECENKFVDTENQNKNKNKNFYHFDKFIKDINKDKTKIIIELDELYELYKFLDLPAVFKNIMELKIINNSGSEIIKRTNLPLIKKFSFQNVNYHQIFEILKNQQIFNELEIINPTFEYNNKVIFDLPSSLKILKIKSNNLKVLKSLLKSFQNLTKNTLIILEVNDPENDLSLQNILTIPKDYIGLKLKIKCNKIKDINNVMNNQNFQFFSERVFYFECDLFGFNDLSDGELKNYFSLIFSLKNLQKLKTNFNEFLSREYFNFNDLNSLSNLNMIKLYVDPENIYDNQTLNNVDFACNLIISGNLDEVKIRPSSITKLLSNDCEFTNGKLYLNNTFGTINRDNLDKLLIEKEIDEVIVENFDNVEKDLINFLEKITFKHIMCKDSSTIFNDYIHSKTFQKQIES